MTQDRTAMPTDAGSPSLPSPSQEVPRFPPAPRAAASLPEVDARCRVDLAATIHGMPASQLLGLQVIGFQLDGQSRIELPIRRELTVEGRVVQGGIVGLLADYAGVSAASCTLPEGWMAVTTGFAVHNLAPAVGDRLVAIGQLQQMSAAQAVSRVDVFALREGLATLVAVGSTTCKPRRLAKP
jgi:uncharacterized protein (TIGR00369 family)